MKAVSQSSISISIVRLNAIFLNKTFDMIILESLKLFLGNDSILIVLVWVREGVMKEKERGWLLNMDKFMSDFVNIVVKYEVRDI